MDGSYDFDLIRCPLSLYRDIPVENQWLTTALTNVEHCL